MKNRPTHCRILAAILLMGIWISGAPAEILFIDSRNGSDENPGTKAAPLQTLAAAAEKVNRSTAPGPTQVILEPGTYNLSRAVLFKNSRPYTEQDRLTITAAILPDDPNWLPKYMPVILSTEPPSKSPHDTFQYSAEKCTFGLKMETSHVTIAGLKFLGNPAEYTWHYPIWRETEDLTDLLVTQCLFVGDKNTLSYLSPICAKGHKIVADHCIFYNCHTPLIFWDAQGGVSKECAVRYCIIVGARIAAVWTTQTGDDFQFHHNLVTRSNYLWMRPRSNQHTYRIADCVIAECKYNSGYGTAFELFGRTGPEIQYTEENVIREGKVCLQEFDEDFDSGPLSAQNRPREYLHPTPDSAGFELGAGLFTGPGRGRPVLPESSQPVAVNEHLSVRQIRKGVYLVTHRFPYGANSLAVEMKDSSLVLVDTPYTPQATKELLDWFEARLGKRKIIAINTGFHWDNLGGNDWLIKQGIAVYGSDLTAKLVKEQAVQSHARMLRQLDTPEWKPYAQALRNLPFVPPSHLFPLEEGLELDFAGEKLRVYYPGPSHAQDNVVVYFPDRKVLFGGCMISGWGGLGNTADADMKAWPNSIRKLKAFDFDLLVPGHGDRLDPNLIEEAAALLKKANAEQSAQETQL